MPALVSKERMNVRQRASERAGGWTTSTTTLRSGGGGGGGGGKRAKAKKEVEEEEEAHSHVSWSKCISVAHVEDDAQDDHQSVQRDFPGPWEGFTQPQPQLQNFSDTSAAWMNGPQPLQREPLTMHQSHSSQQWCDDECVQAPTGHRVPFHGVRNNAFNWSFTAQDGDQEGKAQRG